MASDALSGFSAGERAEIEALLGPNGGAAEDDVWVPEPVGVVRRMIRWVIRLASLLLAGLIGWHIYALSSLPDRPYDAVHAPIALTIGAGVGAALLLLWFDGKPRRLLLFLIGLAALVPCGLSMRWVDSSKSGVREYWSGLERGRAQLAGDLCYRIDARTFELRGAGKARFTYQRGLWPGAYSEAEFRRYFFSDLEMRAGPDGWTCIDRD